MLTVTFSTVRYVWTVPVLLLSVDEMPRLTEFSPREIADMHYYYGMSHGRTTVARTAYINAFPGRLIPSARNFQEIHRRLSNIGLGLARDRREQPAVVIDNAIEEAILNDLFADPTTSIRRLALRHGISKTSVWRILKKEGLHPFHYQRVQHLHENVDNRPRCVMSTWILRKIRADPNFPKRIFWMDEATFTRDGITNCRNLHQWSHENPRLKRASTFQVKFSINVWAALIDDILIGPVILPRTLNAERFLELLQNLPMLMEDVPLATRRRGRMYLQMDGCPAHYGREVRRFLNENYPNRWIGRGGPVGWPARSPDLTPLDYFLWGVMKQRVYSTPINTEAQLHDRIIQCANDIKNDPGMIRRATNQINIRAVMCLQNRGGHFEHLMH